ncbi:MAG: hypothetical protein NDJ94_01360 [Vicinamibacteria bacterium]|nr:hypothetical protein [Vicinamibacteria bacterium]
MSGRRLAGTLAWALAAAVLAVAGLAAGLRQARPLVLDLGPNDAAQLAGFREDWEREGSVAFRWTTLRSEVRFPFALAEPGGRVVLRYRRHFDDPARVRIVSAGATVVQFEARADRKSPYLELEAPLGATRGPLTLVFESHVTNERPLGIALDWVRVEGRGGYQTTGSLSVAVALLAAGTVLLVAAAGAPALPAAAAGLLVAAAIGLGGWWDPMALDRIVQGGLAPWLLTGAAAVLLLRARPSSAWLRVEVAHRPALLALALVALAVRLVLVLHPRFYYPDVRTHALFAGQLARHGLERFLQGFTENQFRYSLGIQLEGDHWYAFPYPPLFYVFAQPLIGLFRLAPELAVSALPAMVNALEVLLVYALARRLAAVAPLRAAALVVVLPIFLARASLALFPALVGHALDTLLLVCLLDLFQAARPRVRSGVVSGLLLATALLAYTQGVLNFGLLLPLVLAWDFFADRTPTGRDRQRALLTAGVLGVTLAAGLFYARYVPVFVDMQRGIPQPEERIWLELQERRALQGDDDQPEEPNDPYAAPTFEATRGLAKAGSRLWIFWGPFALLLPVGVGLLAAGEAAASRRFLIAWASLYIVLNFASGSLPGPNLFRHSKDVEVVAPLCALSLSLAGSGPRSRLAWRAVWMAFVVYAAWRVVEIYGRITPAPLP